MLKINLIRRTDEKDNGLPGDGIGPEIVDEALRIIVFLLRIQS